MRHDTEPLPSGALARLGARRFATGFSLFDFVWSPDGTRLAAITGRGVTLFDARDGRPLLSFNANENPALHPFSVAFSDDASLAALSRDGVLRRWSVETGEALSSLPLNTFTGRLSPDGAVLACVPKDGNARVLLDARTGETIRALDGAIRGGQQRFAWSGDGARLATAGHLSNEIELWDARTGERLFAIHSYIQVIDLKYSPDGGFVAVGGEHGSARVWGTDDASVVLTVPSVSREEHAPCGVALGRGEFACCVNGVIERFDLARGASVARLEPGGECFGLAYAPDGAQLAFRGSACLRRIDCQTGEEIDDGPRMRMPVAAAGLSPDGARAVLVGFQPEITRREVEVRVWSLGDGAITGGSGFSRGRTDVAPDGAFVASERDGALSLATPEGVLLHRWGGAFVMHDVVAVEPDGRGVRFTHTHAANRCRFDLRSATVELLGARTDRSPDGTLRLAYFKGAKKPWRVHDEATDAPVSVLAAPMQKAFFVAWRPATDVLVALGHDGVLRACDARTGAVTGRAIKLIPSELAGHTRVRCATLTPDGRWLAAGDDSGRVVVVDLDANAIRGVLEGHEGPVLCVRASADGKTLLSGGADTTAVLWAIPEPEVPKGRRAKKKA